MFKKKACPHCGRKVDESWSYCPYCGLPLRRADPFENIERLIEKQFESLGKIMSFEMPKGTISITISTGRQPFVRVREPLPIPVEKKARKIPIETSETKEEAKEAPKVTEEPRTKVKHLGFKDVVEIELPGVNSEKDIEVRELEQSIEVKARAGDKLYFTLLPIPPGVTLRKKFSKDRLVLEIER